MSILDNYRTKYGIEFAKDTIRMYIQKKGYNTVDDFLKENPDMLSFDQSSKLLGVIRSHGYFVLNEDEYIKIVQELKQEEIEKSKLKTENLETTIVNGHEFVTYTDEITHEKTVVDNTVSNRDFKEQMNDVQKEHKQFQNSDANNTQNVINYMEDNIKITPDKKSVKDISLDDKEEEEKKVIMAAKLFEIEIGHPVNVDLNSKIIYDNGIIYSIEKRGDSYQVFPQNSKEEEKKTNSSSLVKKIDNLPKAS